MAYILGRHGLTSEAVLSPAKTVLSARDSGWLGGDVLQSPEVSTVERRLDSWKSIEYIWDGVAEQGSAGRKNMGYPFATSAE